MITAKIKAMLDACESGNPAFPPTTLFGEGWLLRVVLDWFATHGGDRYPLSPRPDARWFAEAWLPSAFLARYRGDDLAESRTHADAAIGHFRIGDPGTTSGLTLAEGGGEPGVPLARGGCRMRGCHRWPAPLGCLAGMVSGSRPGQAASFVSGVLVMGIIRRFILLISLLTPPGAALAADPLTIGSPAPALHLAAFLKGDPVEELRRGSVYAIEFSGTQCVPCDRAMPHLTELQKKRPGVILISVYSEKEEEVRAHLAKHDAEIGYRVALDDNDLMNRGWMQASNVNGIPTVYVVGADGVIAWIGDPTDLDGALGKLLDGKVDVRRERMRLAFGQADVGASRAWQARQESTRAEHSRLGALYEQGKWAEAVEGAERAALKFPDESFEFRGFKLNALASDPKTTDQALNFAAELSALMTYSRLGDLGKGRLGTFDVEIAQSLLGDGKNADPLIAEAAAILLGRSEKGLELIKDDEERFGQSQYINQVFAMVDARRGDFASAIGRMNRTLDQISRRPCPETSPERRDRWERRRRSQAEAVESSLADYVEAAEKAKGGR